MKNKDELKDNKEKNIEILEEKDKELLDKNISSNTNLIFFIVLGIGLFVVTILSIYIALNGASNNILNKEKVENINNKPDVLDNEDFIMIKGKVCIDPGHGGTVPETAPDLQEVEKGDTLRLSKLVADILSKHGIEVVMTREDDVEVSLDDRCMIANDNNVDLFVSIHRNISDIPGVGQGIEVWISCKDKPFGDILGENIHRELLDAHIQNDRGIRKGSMGNQNYDYVVNAKTNMASCILEMGFMTDEEDNRLFNEYIDEYATKIANGILSTLKDME